jgi:hypothetical protein
MLELKIQRLLLAAPVLALVMATATPTLAAPIFSQGFETDISGWDTPTRVASGTNGVTSASGGFHALATDDSTHWGGYSTSNGGPLNPFQPYTTSLDIYLNVTSGAANDTRFDFSSAINNSSGNFLRDFVFNAGFYNSSDTTGPGAGTDRFVISAGNNAGRGNSFPKNPGAIAIETTGWYTFQEKFFDNAGKLGVNMSIFNSSDLLVASWVLGGSDLISDVGGNRYGWFATNEFSSLAIDNTSLSVDSSATPLPGALPLFVSGLGLFGFVAHRRKKASAKNA